MCKTLSGGMREKRDAAAAWLQGEGPDAASSLEVGTTATLLWRRMQQEENLLVAIVACSSAITGSESQHAAA